MIGLDTNILARYFVEEEGADPATQAQRQAARQLIESGHQLFLSRAVALELEWVLRQALAGVRGGLVRRIRQLNLPPRVVIPRAA